MSVTSSAPSYIFLLSGLALMGVACGLVSYLLTVGRREKVTIRLRDVKRDYLGAGEDVPTEETRSGPVFVAGAIDMLHGLADLLGNFVLTNARQQEKFRGLLVRNGFRRAEAPRLFMAVKVCCLALGVVVALASSAGHQNAWASLGPLPIGLVGALAGALLPEIVLRQRAKRRLRRIARRLPDALDLLIIFANAGYAMDQAIQRLTIELRRGATDLCDELVVTTNELRGLADRQQALQNFANRTGLEQVQALVSTLAQAHKYGTPLSQALRVLAAEERNRRITQLEGRAGRMAVLITLPVAGLILPGTLLMLMAPALLPNSHEIYGLFHSGRP